MMTAGLVVSVAELIQVANGRNLLWFGIGGLVGLGRMMNGCTSGRGICGVSRLSNGH